MISIWSGVSLLPLSSGGISPAVIFLMTRLFSGCPGWMAALPFLRILVASSRTSRRNLTLRLPSSAPWQTKQFLLKMGRMSRLKSIFVFVEASFKLAVADDLGESPALPGTVSSNPERTTFAVIRKRAGRMRASRIRTARQMPAPLRGPGGRAGQTLISYHLLEGLSLASYPGLIVIWD